MSRLQGLSANVSAFLDMIAFSEGTSRIEGADDGYNVLVGGGLFQGYADHPRKLIRIRNLESTAAGRYQVLARYFDDYKRELKLADFSPESQDKIALQQVKETGALPLVEAGDFDGAVSHCAHIWASLPGAGYGQRENTIAFIRQAFVAHGGTITTQE